MEKKEAIALAAFLLKISIEEAQEYCMPLDNLNAFYFSVPLKGGGSLIILNENEVLFANSSVSFEEHIKAFSQGIRTPLSAFEGIEE